MAQMKKSYLLVLVLFCLHGMLVCLAMNTPSISSDQDALLALKHITLESNQTLAQNWTSASSVCEWIGVTCSSRHHRVTSLDIPNMGLRGTIPPHLGNLSFLVSINLSRNYFHGELPHELAKLHRLKVLNFGYNNLTGEIPASICKMSNLEKLLLRNNSLQGTIPASLSQCTGLHVLSLSHNNLSGVIPTEFGNLKELERLILGYNSLKGVIPKEIGNLTTLQFLSLASNYLTEYGLEGSISTKCDIYSYGIMLMEVFTGVKPSNDMFGGNLSLKGWVKSCLPHSLVEVIDANILRPGEENFKEKLELLSSIMELALNCTIESRKERSNIRDVLAALEKIKLQLST